MTPSCSAHPGERRDPVLWVMGKPERARPVVLKRMRQAGQNWVPAFAGMSGFKS
jgi:hypothetical protein